MKKVSLVFIFFLTVLLSFGQSDHLIPAGDFNSYEGRLKEYYDKVFPLLHTGFSQNPYARYTSMPSFDSPYAFSVEKIDGKCYILSNALSENYWYAVNRMAVKVIVCKMEIDEELYLKIGELFRLLANQTKEEAKKFAKGPNGEMLEVKTIIADGTVYYFALTDEHGNITIGKTHSPHKDSKLDRVIQLCDNLHSMKTENSLNFIHFLIKELK